jgi:hypothetical protein
MALHRPARAELREPSERKKRTVPIALPSGGRGGSAIGGEAAPWLHSSSTVATFKRHRGYIQAAPCLHSSSTVATFKRHRGYIQAAPWLHSSSTVPTFKQHRGYIQAAPCGLPSSWDEGTVGHDKSGRPRLGSSGHGPAGFRVEKPTDSGSASVQRSFRAGQARAALIPAIIMMTRWLAGHGTRSSNCKKS